MPLAEGKLGQLYKVVAALEATTRASSVEDLQHPYEQLLEVCTRFCLQV